MSKKTFIQFLIEDGITYIYNPDAPKMYMCYSNDKWVETNTTHMEWLFREYHSNRFFGRNYTMILKINEEIRYVSSDYNSVINYIRETGEEYKNDVFKIVSIKYDFD